MPDQWLTLLILVLVLLAVGEVAHWLSKRSVTSKLREIPVAFCAWCAH